MRKSLLRSLFLEGGLSVNTLKDGSGTPIVLRTLIQIDAGAVTFADIREGAGTPETLARHRKAVGQALAPLLDALKKIETAATAMVFLASALTAWLAFLHHDVARRALAIGIAQALVVIARLVFPKVFSRTARFVLRLYLRHYWGLPAA